MNSRCSLAHVAFQYLSVHVVAIRAIRGAQILFDWNKHVGYSTSPRTRSSTVSRLRITRQESSSTRTSAALGREL